MRGGRLLRLLIGRLIVVILARHNSRVPIPLGEEDDQRAADKAENRPEPGDMLHRGMGVLLGNEDVGHHEQRQQRQAYPHHRLQTAAKEFDELKNHMTSLWTNCMKKFGYSPISTEMTAVMLSGTTRAGWASVYLCFTSASEVLPKKPW